MSPARKIHALIPASLRIGLVENADVAQHADVISLIL
jgi:hypothetical protein